MQIKSSKTDFLNACSFLQEAFPDAKLHRADSYRVFNRDIEILPRLFGFYIPIDADVREMYKELQYKVISRIRSPHDYSNDFSYKDGSLPKCTFTPAPKPTDIYVWIEPETIDYRTPDTELLTNTAVRLVFNVLYSDDSLLWDQL